MTAPSLLNAHETAAWWSSVAEPADPYSRALRLALGDEEAISWVCADHPGALPEKLQQSERGVKRDWDGTWKRWHPRAQVANPLSSLEWITQVGGYLLIPSDPQWPQGLNDLEWLEPTCLWVRGTLVDRTCVSLVGARACTHAGQSTAAQIGAELCDAGLCVVSGGAFGIDIAAHRGALYKDEGATVAVMGGGLERLYPQAHRDIFEQIATHPRGALISEVPPQWRPARWRFLTRNRVIAAMSDATVVVEADQRSGALATARRAAELGRHVGALPGSVTSAMSRGCHRLIREGATLIRDSADIIEMISGLELHTAQPEPLFDHPQVRDSGVDALPHAQRRVWEALPKRAGSSVDVIAVASGMSVEDVIGALGGLELEGLVSQKNGRWRRAS